ncbi:MAG: RNA methyltransferase [Thermoanaerobaculia bacterium]|nr:RNA methyltransferase [Thermoanaerobaculia bacterium]
MPSQLHGYHPVREALRHRPEAVAAVLVARGRGGRRRSEIEALCARAGVPVEEVPEAVLDELAPVGVHNGFAVRLTEGATGEGDGPAASPESRPGGEPRSEGDDAGANTGRRGRSPGEGSRPQKGGPDPQLVVLAEDVQDPRNLGALIRVCESAGVGRFLLRDRGSAPVSPTVVKASAGAAEWLRVERITNTAIEIERLKKSGYWVYGAAAGGRPPWDVDLTGPLALCLGGEEKGLRRRTRTLCDGLLGLPMQGRVESLNVATAAAALIYEAVRQRLG